MVTIFNKLKSQLALLIGAIVGVLMLYISALKKSALRKELDLMQSSAKAQSESNDALLKGLEEEGRKVKRGYFDGDGK